MSGPRYSLYLTCADSFANVISAPFASSGVLDLSQDIFYIFVRDEVYIEEKGEESK